MRAGACTAPQTLTSEAASALKHSLSLARRRGHAQVTPLHVAATLLSSRASLLRRACLKSQPHHQPLHSRALELCFNVALNRLPTAPGPLLHGQPSLSNALIAALKRAQAHQRRGCIEQQQQQQPQLLAIKVELEQLILSILDDPSVSRVMREAGFSSTLVKNNIEDSPPVFHSYTTTSGGGVYSSPSSPSRTPFFQNPFLSTNGPNQKTVDDNNMKIVLELVLRNGKGKNAAIIGDSVSTTERLVLNMIEKVEMQMIDMPEEIRSTRFVIFKVSEIGLRLMRREEVEVKVSELKRKVEYYCVSSRPGVVVIYIGDMKWIVDNSNNNNSGDGYSPVDHLVEEIGKMVSSTAKVSLMATANYHTYMRCQMRQPPLDLQWSLQPVSVPSGGLGLSLNATSVHESRMTFSHNPSQLLEKQETCCAECTINYEKEATMFKSGHHKSSSLYASSWSPKNMDNGSNPNPLPCWLQSHGSELRERDNLADLKRKWNTLCHNLHQGKHTLNHINSSLSNNQSIIGKNYSYTSSYPWWPNPNPNPNPNSPFPEKNSISFADSSSMPRFRRQQSCHIEFSFSNGNQNHKEEPNLDSLKSREGKELKITLALGNGIGNSVFSDSRKMGGKDICRILLENVPWQSDSIPSIVESLIDSRVLNKREIWLLIQGNDGIGKKRLGRGIAESVFGSADLFFSMNTRRENEVEKLEMALRSHEKLVVLVEDVDFADTQLVKFLKDRLGTEKIDESGEKESGFGQKIFILTNGGDPRDYFDGAKKNQEFSVVQMKLVVNKVNSNHKRRPEWDLSNETKIAKINDKNDDHSSLDLNVKANGDEDEEREEKPTTEFSPVSSDLTLETANDLSSGPLGFLKSIRNRFVFNRDSDKDSRMREMFLSKIRLSFEEVFGSGEMGGLIVEQVVLDEVLLGCGAFLNGVFGKWLKDVFQTCLESVKIGGKGDLNIRLCLGGGQGDNEGFMGSNLPKEIQLSFMH